MKQHISGDSDRDKFAEFLRSKVRVVRASLPPKTDLNRYFEIMNTRGQQLQQVDIVKARLMSHLDNDTERACFAWIWDACADMESYVQMSLTRVEKGLRKELRTRLFGETWSWLTAKDFKTLCDIHRQDQPGAGTPAPAPSKPLPLDDALEKYADSRIPSTDEDLENVRFRSTIEFPAFLLHVLKIMECDANELEGHLDDKLLVKRFDECLDKDPAQQIGNFAFKLLQCRNLFDSFILKRQYTTTHGDNGDWSLQRFIKRVSKNQETPGYVNTLPLDSHEVEEDGAVDGRTNDLLLIQSMLRVTFTSARTMHWITMLLKSLVGQDPSKVNEAALVNLLRDYARDKVKKAFPFDEHDQPVGFSINRIVFTYLDYLLITDQPKSEFRFSFRNSIEHFYPQHPDDQQSGAVVSEQCLHLLGNLALVSVGANSKFSNSMPKAKAENFKTTIKTQSPKLQKMAEITSQPQGWGDEQIRAHHDEVIDLLREDVDHSNCADSPT